MTIIEIQSEDNIFDDCKHMASAVVEVLKTKGECRPSDLESKGFSSNEIKRHFSMAYALARVELNWMDA